MSDEMKPCPFGCGGEVWVDVRDSEGNYQGHLGGFYEREPYNGLRYSLQHEGWGDCPCCTGNDPMGGMLFDSEAEAIAAWNRRDERKCHSIATCGDGCFCPNCEVFVRGKLASRDACGFIPARYCPYCGTKVVVGE